MSATTGFHETNLETVPIRQLGLSISGTPLEPLLAEFEGELQRAGITRLKPRFYLSNEWGVPFGSIAIAIPFYLAHPQLTSIHEQRTGFVEGTSRWDILRYLRHEMGHVFNYGYRLYEQPDWLHLFGRMDEPYQEEYRPEPFSRRFVQHLPGWYAQKHPDEDWAETFAVWLTPGRDWRTEYADWPVALEKLEYCHCTIAALGDTEPLVTSAELDEDVNKMESSLAQFYGSRMPSRRSFATIWMRHCGPFSKTMAARRIAPAVPSDCQPPGQFASASRRSWPKFIAGPGTFPMHTAVVAANASSRRCAQAGLSRRPARARHYCHHGPDYGPGDQPVQRGEYLP